MVKRGGAPRLPREDTAAWFEEFLGRQGGEPSRLRTRWGAAAPAQGRGTRRVGRLSHRVGGPAEDGSSWPLGRMSSQTSRLCMDL